MEDCFILLPRVSAGPEHREVVVAARRGGSGHLGWVTGAGGDARFARGAARDWYGLHPGEPRPGHPAAGDPDDARDGDGIHFRRCRYLLRVVAGSLRRRYRGPDGIRAHAGVCGGDWAVYGHDGAGRAAHRREETGGSGRWLLLFLMRSRNLFIASV